MANSNLLSKLKTSKTLVVSSEDEIFIFGKKTIFCDVFVFVFLMLVP